MWVSGAAAGPITPLSCPEGPSWSELRSGRCVRHPSPISRVRRVAPRDGSRPPHPHVTLWTHRSLICSSGDRQCPGPQAGMWVLVLPCRAGRGKIMAWRGSSGAAHFQSPLPASDTLFTEARGRFPREKTVNSGDCRPLPHPRPQLCGASSHGPCTGAPACPPLHAWTPWPNLVRRDL